MRFLSLLVTKQKTMKTILIVDDSSAWVEMYVKRIPENIAHILVANTLADGEKLFSQNPNPDLIVMDCCVDHENILDSLPLIRKMRETYNGDMVASSSNSIYRMDMIEAGCNLQADKGDIRPIIHKALGI